MMFAILFGLSMDYEVFLLSRIREAYAARGETSGAVVEGLARTARVITAAAAIMVAVFGAFVLSGEVFLKLIGVGPCVGGPDRRHRRAHGAGAGGDAAAGRAQLVGAALARPGDASPGPRAAGGRITVGPKEWRLFRERSLLSARSEESPLRCCCRRDRKSHHSAASDICPHSPSAAKEGLRNPTRLPIRAWDWPRWPMVPERTL